MDAIWSDTVDKWYSAVDHKVPGLNPTCCFTGKVFSLPVLPLGDQPLAEGARRTFAFSCLFISIQELKICPKEHCVKIEIFPILALTKHFLALEIGG